MGWLGIDGRVEVMARPPPNPGKRKPHELQSRTALVVMSAVIAAGTITGCGSSDSEEPGVKPSQSTTPSAPKTDASPGTGDTLLAPNPFGADRSWVAYQADRSGDEGVWLVPGPYVLVGTSGGGYITAGYAYRHPQQTAGLVFIDVGHPFVNPPAELVADTAWDSPVNIEKRDYLQVEKDAWAARRLIGDIPVTVVTVKYSPAAIAESPFPSERSGMRRNVSDQQGWLVLSPIARQLVVHTGHAVEEDDSELVLDVILDVVRAAR
jgi:pimeloyl-ACP methyl ester carboxylesterase